MAVPKTLSPAAAALVATATTKSVLKPREREVLVWTAAGYTDKQVATRLGLATDAVTYRICGATRRLGLRNRCHLIAYCVRHNLLEARP